MLEVSYFKELFFCCVDKLNIEKRIIQLQGRALVSLAPTIFRRMLRLPKPTMMFKSFEVDAFLKANHGRINILEKFLIELSGYFGNLYQLEVCSLKYPFELIIIQRGRGESL